MAEVALYFAGNVLAWYGLYRVIVWRRSLAGRLDWIQVIGGLVAWFALLMVVDMLTSTFSRRLPPAFGTMLGSGLSLGLLLTVKPSVIREAVVWMLGSTVAVVAVNLLDHGG